jgi:UDP-N-acetyl-D-galactosamine dehydrogenase
MGGYVAERVARLMMHKRIHVVDSKILVMGLSFKENCPDIRNSKVIDIIKEFEGFNANVDVYDPWIDAEEVQHEYGFTPVNQLVDASYDAVVLAVAHRQFAEMGIEKIRGLGKPDSVLFDVKYLFGAAQVDGRL